MNADSNAQSPGTKQETSTTTYNDAGAVVNVGASELSFLSSNSAPIRAEIACLQQQGFLLRQLLADEECSRLIAFAEELGFDNFDSLTYFDPKYRDSRRIMINSPELGETLWKRMTEHFGEVNIDVDPAKLHISGTLAFLRGRWEPVGLNPLFRLCKYVPGGHFAPHCDGIYEEGDDFRSFQTFMVYLNGDFEGGSTNFLAEPPRTVRNKGGKLQADESCIQHRLQPEAGAAIVFNHNRWHEGESLRNGVKYILRTDVMYKRCRSTNR